MQIQKKKESNLIEIGLGLGVPPLKELHKVSPQSFRMGGVTTTKDAHGEKDTFEERVDAERQDIQQEARRKAEQVV